MWLQSNRGRWDNVADDKPILLDDHLIDHQPQDALPGLERRVGELVPDAVAERVQTLQQPEFLLTLRMLTVDLVAPGSQVAAMVVDLPSALLQLLKRDCCRLVCVDQALDLTFRHLELPSNARLFAHAGAVDSEVAAAFLEVRPQQVWLGQQLGGPLPTWASRGAAVMLRPLQAPRALRG